MLNTLVFKNIQSARKQVLVVTKYLDRENTLNIISNIEASFPDEFYGIGENRIEVIREKKLPRELVHFIGNIQSQKIAAIIERCSVIHSLASIKHAMKIESQGENISVFIQIQLDANKSIGVPETELSGFLEACKDMKYLKVIGLSGMGSSIFDEREKREEFQKLVCLRDRYIPDGIISAGTSRDYELAIEEGINIVRIGKKILTEG